jgi:hypothetical protein
MPNARWIKPSALKSRETTRPTVRRVFMRLDEDSQVGTVVA